MRPENEFILQCLKEFITGETGMALNHTLNGLSTEYILRQCRRHKVLLIVQAVTNQYGNNSLGVYTSNKIFNYLHHKIRLETCHRLFKLLTENQIPFAVLKGPYLSQVAYGEMGWRSSNDVDLLVKRDDLSQVIHICKEDGFLNGHWDAQKKAIVPLSREEKFFYTMNTHQVAPLIKLTSYPQLPYAMLDINFSLKWGEDHEPVDVAAFLEDCLQVEYGGVAFPVLRGEKFLIQLCLHNYKDANSLYLLAQNNGINLRNFCDIYYFIFTHRKNLSVPQLINLVKEYSLEKYVYYVLFYTDWLFGGDDFIQHILAKIKPTNLDFLHQFGLADEEIKTWNVDAINRIFAENCFELIEPILTPKDLEKIQLNHKFM